MLALAVASEHRRRGVGHALMEEFVRGAQCAGVRWVFALLDEGKGIRGRTQFFRAVGFTEVDDPDEAVPAIGR